MQTIGLIGGMSWESTAQYYSLINQGVRARLGGSHSARILMDSLDFGPADAMLQAGDWAGLGDMLASSARNLVAGGADFIVLATNTMHRLAPEIEAASALPLLHIADPLGAAIAAQRFDRVGLVGTAFTMEQPFLRDRLGARFGIETVIPDTAARGAVHGIIFQELVCGVVSAESREVYRGVLADLAADGCQAIILGCTEIMLLIGAADSVVPLFDTTALHASAAVERALA